MTQTPQTYDMDAWLTGASRPTRTCRVYRDGALLAELDRLSQQIKEAEAAGVDEAERRLSDKDPAADLRARYAELAESFYAGGLDVTVRSCTVAEENKIKAGRENPEDHDAVNRDLVHASLVSPAMSREQFDRFVDTIGVYQWRKLVRTYLTASAGDVEPDADFLPRASTPADTE